MDIQGFKGSFNDFARPNLFIVQVNRLDGTKLKFHAKSASLPGSMIEPVAVPYMGRTIKIAGDRSYEDWKVTVMLDTSFQIRNDLYAWHEQINSTVGNAGSPSAEAYKSDGLVQALSKAGQVIATYNFVGMFPTTVDAIEYSRDSGNAIAECGVTLAYDYYERA